MESVEREHVAGFKEAFEGIFHSYRVLDKKVDTNVQKYPTALRNLSEENGKLRKLSWHILVA